MILATCLCMKFDETNSSKVRNSIITTRPLSLLYFESFYSGCILIIPRFYTIHVKLIARKRSFHYILSTLTIREMDFVNGTLSMQIARNVHVIFVVIIFIIQNIRYIDDSICLLLVYIPSAVYVIYLMTTSV